MTPSTTPLSTTSPSTTPPSTPPTTAPTGTPCTTSADNGYCPGPGRDYSYPGIALSNGSNTYINNNVFNHNQLPSATQTLNAYDPGNWSVTANMAAGNTAVISGPQVRQDVPGGFDPLSNFHYIYASATDDQHPNSGTGAEFGYDIWTSTSSGNAFSQEMMIWTDTINRGICGGATPVASNVSFGGSNGVPVESWNLCRNGPAGSGSEYIWYLPGTQDHGGHADVYAMLRWMISHGYYSSGTGLNQLDETFEICSTGGQPETFSASGLSITSG